MPMILLYLIKKRLQNHMCMITFFNICIEKMGKGTHPNVSRFSLWTEVIFIFALHCLYCLDLFLLMHYLHYKKKYMKWCLF